MSESSCQQVLCCEDTGALKIRKYAWKFLDRGVQPDIHQRDVLFSRRLGDFGSGSGEDPVKRNGSPAFHEDSIDGGFNGAMPSGGIGILMAAGVALLVSFESLIQLE